MSSETDRLPYADIPEDRVCPHPECEGRQFDSVIGFRSHMFHKHETKYEKKPGSEFPTGVQKANEKEDVDELDTWQMFGIAMHEVYGLPYTQVAEKIREGRGASTLGKAASSEAGKKFRKLLREEVSDPTRLVSSMLKSAQLDILFHWFGAFHGAAEAGAYDLVHKMAKEIGLKDILDSAEPERPPVVIQLSGGQISAPVYETSYEELEGEIVEDGIT